MEDKESMIVQLQGQLSSTSEHLPPTIAVVTPIGATIAALRSEIELLKASTESSQLGHDTHTGALRSELERVREELAKVKVLIVTASILILMVH
jgi:uncharacterized small protein (DUF1192 family)